MALSERPGSQHDLKPELNQIEFGRLPSSTAPPSVLTRSNEQRIRRSRFSSPIGPLASRSRTFRGAADRVYRAAARLPGGCWECPWCGHQGRFAAVASSLGRRPHARCPRCGAAERHRLQRAAFLHLLEAAAAEARVLHFAPESVIEAPLRGHFASYLSADLDPARVDLALDITSMASIPDGSIDIVWASHVLEHVRDDRTAIEEIHRVLRPGGWAVLPVPIVADRTVEYEQPCAVEHGHVRAPGPDYFDRFRRVFDTVEVIESDDVDPRWQTWIHEDRTNPPQRFMPERPAQAGVLHRDYVPVCRK